MANIKNARKAAAGLLLAATALAASGPASAVVLTGAAQAETSTFQDGLISPFVWTFSGLSAGTGSASLLVNFARLDLNPGESLRARIDGTSIGLITNSNTTSCVEGYDVTYGGFVSDCDGSASFSFSTSFINDGSLTVRLENYDGVNSLIDRRNGAGWASIAVSYAQAQSVPEPGTLALLGLGLAGLGLSRRRKAS